jgi:hypothetical protein
MARSYADVQAELTAAYSARRAALLGQSYSLDTGQGRQTVTRANLTEISHLIQALEAELDEATNGANPSITFERDSV